jgi:hypothetical protein
MRLIVTHLTRMQPGYICVAGVDEASGRQVRPVLRGRLRTELLVTRGGFLDLAVLVDLGPVEPCGQPPEVEDHSFELRHARAVGLAAAEAFWAALTAGAQTHLGAIFGPDLVRAGNGCAVPEGGGSASLGALRPAAPPVLRLTDEGKLRVTVTDGALTVSLPVTDLRLFERDTCDAASRAGGGGRRRSGAPDAVRALRGADAPVAEAGRERTAPLAAGEQHPPARPAGLAGGLARRRARCGPLTCHAWVQPPARRSAGLPGAGAAARPVRRASALPAGRSSM